MDIYQHTIYSYVGGVNIKVQFTVFKIFFIILGIIYIIDFDRQMTGTGLAYRPHHVLWVQSLDYRVDLAAGLLATHHQTPHGILLGEHLKTPSHPPEEEQ